ncbi:hypothetical protein BJF90_41845 [Pseudonocardia sp. CNS-004]|nr:hypothetical protein BJF90_41845 [Pseudonocardia sp. CNS-004]
MDADDPDRAEAVRPADAVRVPWCSISTTTTSGSSVSRTIMSTPAISSIDRAAAAAAWKSRIVSRPFSSLGIPGGANG